jgi:predicted ATP-grasp superfamily ATP-dependent carboligase
MSFRPHVAIFDADAPPALAFVRSLGRAGVPLRVYSHRPWPVCRYSRWCADFARCPDPANGKRFAPWLAEELRAGRIDLVAPTSDVIAFHVAMLTDEFAPSLRARFEPAEGVLASLFKDRFDAVCRRLGFATPWAFFPQSVEEARALAGIFRYPAIVKPKSHVGVGIARGEIVRDASELRSVYREYQLPKSEAERFPELALPMVQEYVPRALENLYSVSGALGANGEIVAAAATRKIAQWPPTLGIGIEFHSIDDPPLVSHGAALAAAVLGRGLFEVELIRDPRDGRCVAIDLNPRAHGFVSLDVKRGNDLPLLWYRIATGEAVSSQSTPRHDVAWKHGVPHAVQAMVQRLREAAPGRLERVETVDVVHDPDDRLPSIPFVATMLRHPGGLIRPFWRSTPAPSDPRGALAVG